MELVPSVSRSSGLEDGGDALKGGKLQEEYRHFIEDKVQQYRTQYPIAGHQSTPAGEGQRNAQSNILILLRKLREGLMASKRVDAFAIEVYELSLHLSILFRSPVQTTSIIAQLLPQGRETGGLYNAYSASSQTGEAQSASLPDVFAEMSLQDSRRGSSRQIYRPPHARRGQRTSSSLQHASPVASPPVSQSRPSASRQQATPSIYLFTTLLSLLHTLLHIYPAQSSYHAQLKSYQHFQSNNGGSTSFTAHYCYRWLKSLSAALASRNYARVERLTRSPEVEGVYRSLDHSGAEWPDSLHAEVKYFAFKCLVTDLRAKMCQTAWTILRTAYRDLDINDSADWLVRCLMIAPDMHPSGNELALERWLEERTKEVKRKEGYEGRWILCKVLK